MSLNIGKNLISEYNMAMRSAINQFCRRHPIQLIDSFCLECLVPICNQCIREHKDRGHQCAPGGKAKGEVRSLLHCHRDRLVDLQENISIQISSIRLKQKQNEQTKREAVQEVVDTIDSIIEHCQQTKLTMITFVQQQDTVARMAAVKELTENL